eukprot:CAMPEP_0196794888 /NCGR_PEP_ID=MMETSP1104-20130614/35112_1 /TAXON_ID=33652 /ORGANISM="Cafeteria sp., Strain Caron Lab Isolate" /LENGTH=113 /DNA_ID=CAMNT_0042165271 /DNA_START=189 /DNA_END=526 /DNA_ORIENTATION=-
MTPASVDPPNMATHCGHSTNVPWSMQSRGVRPVSKPAGHLSSGWLYGQKKDSAAPLEALLAQKVHSSLAKHEQQFESERERCRSGQQQVNTAALSHPDFQNCNQKHEERDSHR